MSRRKRNKSASQLRAMIGFITASNRVQPQDEPVIRSPPYGLRRHPSLGHGPHFPGHGSERDTNLKKGQFTCSPLGSRRSSELMKSQHNAPKK